MSLTAADFDVTDSGRVLAWTRRVRGRGGASGRRGCLPRSAYKGVQPVPRGDAESLTADSTGGTRPGRPAARSPAKRRSTSATTATTRSGWQCGGEAGRPRVAEHRRGQAAIGGGGLEGRDQPHAAGQEVDVHLQTAVAGAGDGQLEEGEARQEARRLCGGAGSHERGSRAGPGEQLEGRVRLGVARVRRRARAVGEALPGMEVGRVGAARHWHANVR